MRGRIAFVTLFLFVATIAADARVYLMDVKGTAWIEGGKGRRTARSGVEIADGERIVTGTDGRVKALLADASTILVGPRSIVRVEGSGASTSSVSIQKGLTSIKSSPYRWGSEALQISTPISTSGVRGTEFSVAVAQSGEALFSVDHGLVAVPGAEIKAGQSASVLIERNREPLMLDAIPDADQWAGDRDEELARDPGPAVKIFSDLIHEAIAVRVKAVLASFGIIRDVANALKVKEEGDKQQRDAAKIARVLEALKNGIQNVRAIWQSDRELWLRESVLKSLVESSLLKPGQKIVANFALKFAENDAKARAEHLKQAEKGSSNVGAATVFLAALAASDAAGDRGSARLIEENLGIPLGAKAIDGSKIRVDFDDLGWRDGHSWQVMRTIRGREDFRVKVEMRIHKEGEKIRLKRDPIAFDSAYTLVVHSESDRIILDDLEGGMFDKKENKAILPFVLYDFPLTEGRVWVGWRGNGKKPAVVERKVIGAERVTIGGHSYDALKIETRWYSPDRKFSLLVNVEWLAPDVGQIREMAFRGELGSLEWDERISIPGDT